MIGQGVINQRGAVGKGGVCIALLFGIFYFKLAVTNLFSGYLKIQRHTVADLRAAGAEHHFVFTIGRIQRNIQRVIDGLGGGFVLYMNNADLLAVGAEGAAPALGNAGRAQRDLLRNA